MATFYFGARELHKSREYKVEVEKVKTVVQNMQIIRNQPAVDDPDTLPEVSENIEEETAEDVDENSVLDKLRRMF